MHTAHLCDLDFVDNSALINETWAIMQLTISILEEESSKVGLFIYPDKCKVMTTSAWYERTAGTDLEAISDFCYLGS